ncbi:MAG: class I SAM-dependent methyltransferase [Patescibacteria group bacterium]
MNYRDKFYSKYVSTQTSHLYGEVNLDDIKKQFPVWRKYFGRFLPKDKNAKILDFGCGNGGFVYWLQKIGYQNVEGIDASGEQVEVAKKLGIKNIYQLKDIDAVDKYDIVFMKDVLEHFNKDEIMALLEKIHKALKDRGVLIIQTPNAESPFSGRLRYGDFTHEISFTESSVRQALLVSGFKNVVVCGTYPIVHGIKSLIRFILWRIIELKLRFYILIETGSDKGIFTQNLIAKAEK